jgi:hypothetical protein
MASSSHHQVSEPTWGTRWPRGRGWGCALGYDYPASSPGCAEAQACGLAVAGPTVEPVRRHHHPARIAAGGRGRDHAPADGARGETSASRPTHQPPQGGSVAGASAKQATEAGGASWWASDGDMVEGLLAVLRGRVASGPRSGDSCPDRWLPFFSRFRECHESAFAPAGVRCTIPADAVPGVTEGPLT